MLDCASILETGIDRAVASGMMKCCMESILTITFKSETEDAPDVREADFGIVDYVNDWTK